MAKFSNFSICLLKKINRAVLCASLTILLYIFSNYLVGILLAIGNSKFLSSLEILVILSSVIYIVIVFGVKKASVYTLKKVHVSERLTWLSAILSTVTFISYFIIIVIERFGGEHSSMGQANEIFIIGYGVLSTLVFLVLLYSLQKEYVTKEKQKEMQYLKEYTDQLEKNYTEMRRFKHDYQNILFSIEEYIQEKDLVKLEEYFYTKIKKVSTSVTEKNMNLTKLKKKFSTNNQS